MVVMVPFSVYPTRSLLLSQDGNLKKKKQRNYKRVFDGSLILPMGGHGGVVIIYADESKDTLLEFHKKSWYNAKRGGNVDAMGVLSSQLHNGLAAPALWIPIPLDIVVKRKRGKLLADLAQPADEVVVAKRRRGGVLVLGQPGVEHSLQLILRVIADVGIIGLGRNFLRHLRRTRLLVHVIDATTDDPVGDYRTLKEELRMFNPEYLKRPYIVVLNKIDIPEAMESLPNLTKEIWRIGSDDIDSHTSGVSEKAAFPFPSYDDQIDIIPQENKVKEIEEYPRPLAVVGISLLKGVKIAEMLKEIREALRSCQEAIELWEVSTES